MRPSDENDWTAPGECAGCGQSSCICKPKPKKKWQTRTDTLRETEREIASHPEDSGVTGEEWERIRQWPGEF